MKKFAAIIIGFFLLISVSGIVLANQWPTPIFSGNHSFTDDNTGDLIASLHPSTVPVPATMFLLGTGLICLAGIGRKKFSKK